MIGIDLYPSLFEPGCAGPGPRPSPGHGSSMNDAVGIRSNARPGPSWARPNWPLAELDELNLGLDPTQATIEKVKAAVAEKAAQTTSDPAGDPPRRRGQHPRDDADPHLSRARAPRRRPRSAAADPPRRPGRPHRRISRLLRRRPRPADLAVRRARLRAGDRARDRRASSSAITAATSASNICTSTTSRSGASSRSGWRARTPRSSSRPRASSRS